MECWLSDVRVSKDMWKLKQPISFKAAIPNSKERLKNRKKKPETTHKTRYVSMKISHKLAARARLLWAQIIAKEFQTSSQLLPTKAQLYIFYKVKHPNTKALLNTGGMETPSTFDEGLTQWSKFCFRVPPDGITGLANQFFTITQESATCGPWGSIMRPLARRQIPPSLVTPYLKADMAVSASNGVKQEQGQIASSGQFPTFTLSQITSSLPFFA